MSVWELYLVVGMIFGFIVYVRVLVGFVARWGLLSIFPGQFASFGVAAVAAFSWPLLAIIGIVLLAKRMTRTQSSLKEL